VIFYPRIPAVPILSSKYWNIFNDLLIKTVLKIHDEAIETRSSQDAELYILDCAGRTALFRGLRAGPHSGRLDVSRLLKAATRRRTPKAYVGTVNANPAIWVFSIMDS
jgi:hypothetical protein